MRGFVAAVVAAFAFSASALPSWPSWGFHPDHGCLTKESAHQLVHDFIELSNGDAFNVTLAKELLAKDVVDTSGSVASIINAGTLGPVPLLGPTLANRSDFIAANSAQASTPYQPLNIYWTCDVVVFRFVIDFKPQPVLGISILETVPAPKERLSFKIKQVRVTHPRGFFH